MKYLVPIAVIMSVYKKDDLLFLKESIESLLNQTYSQVDIFIQQDGALSHDIESYLDHLYEANNITYLGKRETNKGLAFSLNELLEKTLDKYTYIARMDADDISLPQRIEKQFEFMENNTDIDVCGCHIEEFYDSQSYSKIVKYPLTHSECKAFFMKRVPIAHPTAFFRVSFFEKSGHYTNTIKNQDTLLWMNGFKNKCQFSNVDDVLLKMRTDTHFFKRRSNLQFRLIELTDRFKVIKTLGYPKYAYLYAIIIFLILGLPPRLLKIVYRVLR